MPIEYKTGNVLDHKATKPTILIHICNDRGGWGSGFVVPLAKKWKVTEASYREWYSTTVWDAEDCDRPAIFALGEVQFINVNDNITVGNMIGQSTPGGVSIQIGKEKEYLRPIRLESLRECLLRVAERAKLANAEVIGPMFGSGLAGGKWDEEIVPLIESCLCKYDIPVTIYRFEGK